MYDISTVILFLPLIIFDIIKGNGIIIIIYVGNGVTKGKIYN